MAKFKMAKPISPDGVIELKKFLLPDEVFTAFNKMIAKNWDNGHSKFKQDEVIDEIIRLKPSGLPQPSDTGGNNKAREYIYDNHWLDVEVIYREEGWDVTYDKPGYNETYAATFEFRKKR